EDGSAEDLGQESPADQRLHQGAASDGGSVRVVQVATVRDEQDAADRGTSRVETAREDPGAPSLERLKQPGVRGGEGPSGAPGTKPGRSPALPIRATSPAI